MTNPRLQSFLANVLPDWNEYSEELQNKLLTENADPAQLEKTLFEAVPDLYIREQRQPGYVKQIAGQLTGGVGIIEGALSVPGQVVGSTMEGAGGLLELAGMPALAQMGEDIRTYNTPAYGTEAGRFLGDVGTSIGQNVGLLAGAALAAPLFSNPITAVPIATAAGMGLLAGGRGAHEYLKARPGETGGAALYGLASGLFEAVGEAAAIPGLSNLMKVPGLKSMAGYMGQEVGSELITEALNIGKETLANINQPRERVVGDVETPIATRLGATALGAVIATPVIGGAATLMSPRIRAAQQRIFDRKAAVETQSIDRLIEEGKAVEIKAAEPTIEASPPVTDTELQQAEPTIEAPPPIADAELQRADIKDLITIIDEYNAAGQTQEADQFMDELFNNYDENLILEALNESSESVSQTEDAVIEEQLPAPTVESETPAPVQQPQPAAASREVGKDLIDQARRAATIYEYMQEGNAEAASTWQAFPLNIKNAVPHLLSAERAGIEPGNKFYAALQGRTVEQAVEERFPEGRMPGQAEVVEEDGKRIVKPSKDMRKAAEYAADLFERKETGDKEAEAAWNQITDSRVKNTVPYILRAKKQQQRPGNKAARALLGRETAGADEVRFESSVRPATQQEISQWEAEEKQEYQEYLRNLRGKQPDPVDINTLAARARPNLGDTVTLWAKTTKAPRKPSATIRQNMLTGVKILEETEDGNFKVELPDGNTVTVGLGDIVPSSIAGTRGIDVVLGPKAPSTYSLITAVKDLMTNAKGWLKMTTDTGMNPKAFGEVSVRATDGRVLRMRLDYALNLTENLLETTLGHEVGHIVSLIDEATSVPGMERFRPQKGTLLGDLLGEYSIMQQYILTKPFEFAPGADAVAIYSEQQKFVDGLYAKYEAAGRPMDGAGLTAIQRNWNDLTRKYADTMLSNDEKDEARKTAKVSAALAQDPASFKQFYNDAIDRKLKQKGLVQAYMVRREMETIAMRMRGVPDNVANRRLMQKISGREIFADFFSAKMLDVMGENEAFGRMVPLAEYYAPAASALFDEYMARKPATQKFFEKLTHRHEGADAIVEDLIERMKKVDEQNAENERLKSPEESILCHTLGQKMVNLSMMQLVDRNLPLYWEVEKTRGYAAAEQLTERMEQLAGISAIATPFMDDAAATFDMAIQALRKAIPQDAGKAERLMGVYMMYKRIMEGGRTGRITQELTDTELQEIKEIITEFEMYSGAFGGKAQAAKVLSEHSVFSKPEVREALDAALDTFSGLWDKHVLNRLEASGLTSAEQVAVLRKNKHYATYAIERELIGQSGFKAVSPVIKQATGTFQDARNPLGATLEKAISLIWQSYLNEAKIDTVDMLGEQWAKPVEKQGSNFPQPIDQKNWSLVTLKRGGKDFGYHVPEIFANGLNFQGGNHSQGQFLRILGSSSTYFRQLYTTWNPKFTGKNAWRDFSRMVMRSIDPTNARGLGLGVIPQYVLAVGDVLAGKFSPRIQEKLNEEERALYAKSLILSGYDFRARDAQDTSSFQNLIRQYLPRFRGADEANAEQSWMGSLLGKYAVGRQINWVVGAYTGLMEDLSRGLERLPKRAAYRYYSRYRGNMSEAQFNQLVRKAGSPYFLNHGEAHKITANVFTFFNPAVQGLYEDIALMRQKPVVAAKYALATTMSLGFSVGGMYALARLGAKGDALRKLLMNIDEDTLDSNICIPLGTDASGRTTHIRIPLDETSAMFVRLTRRLFELRIGEALMEPINAVTPNPQPLFHLAQFFGVMAGGGNPINWRGKYAIPQRDFEEGGYYKWRHFMREAWNTASPFTPFYRFSSTSAIEEARAGSEKPSNAVAGVIGDMLDMPTQALSLGLLHTTNRGVAEQSDKLLADLRSSTAKAGRLTESLASAAARGNKDKLEQLTMAITDLALSSPERAIAVSSAMDKLDAKMKEILLGGNADRFMLEFLSKSQAEQLALLNAKWPILRQELSE